jgi:hypothetical protein
LEIFHARDDDGGRFGEITFTISSALGNGDEDYFEIREIDSKKSKLRLKKNIEEKKYQVSPMNYSYICQK